MTTTTGPRPMTDTERQAWTMHLQKVPVPTIQARTDLSPVQIAAAVDLGQVHARLAMKSSTAALLEPPAPVPPTVVVKSARTAPEAPASDEGRPTVAELIAWAEKSGVTRAMTLAARVNEYLAELRKIQEQHDARIRAQAKVDRLAAELEAAKNELRQAGGVNTRSAGSKSKPDESRRERLAAIRAWAPGVGHEVSPLGRIPQHIEDDYDAAMAAREAAS